MKKQETDFGTISCMKKQISLVLSCPADSYSAAEEILGLYGT
jgi:hypothetical protein